MCYDIHAFGWGFSDSGLFGVHAATGDTNVEELVQVIMTELRSVALDGPNQAELDRVLALDLLAARAAQVARDTLVFGRQLTTQELIERIENVSTTDVGRLAAGFAVVKEPVTASVGPEGVSERLREAVQSGAARETVH